MSYTVTDIDPNNKKLSIAGTDWVSAQVFGEFVDIIVRNDGGETVHVYFTDSFIIPPNDIEMQTKGYTPLELGGLLFEYSSRIFEGHCLWVKAVTGTATVSIRVNGSYAPSPEIKDLYDKIEELKKMTLMIDAYKSPSGTRPAPILAQSLFVVPKYVVNRNSVMLFVDGRHLLGGYTNNADEADKFDYLEMGTDKAYSTAIKLLITIPISSDLVALSFTTGAESGGGGGGGDGPIIDDTFIRTVDNVNIRGLTALELKKYMDIRSK